MSSTIYKKAFEAQLKHNFYVYTGQPVNNEFKVNRDMALVPTKECAELMRRGRMRFVPSLKGFTALYQAYINPSNALEPFTKLGDDSEFVFSMHMDVSSIDLFLNVSNLNVGSKTYGPGKFFMLDYTVDGGTSGPPGAGPLSLNASLANSLRGPLFGYTFKPVPSWNGSADIKIFAGDVTGPLVLTIEDIPYNNVNGTFSTEIDLSGQPKGFYVLRAYQANTNTVIDSNDFYVDGDLASKNTFGIMRLKYEDIDKMYDSVTDSSNFFTFSYTFAVRSVKWRYYVVAENLSPAFFSSNDLKILKTGQTFNASFPGTPFSQQNGQPDPKIKINGKNTVVFQSASAIPYTENVQKEFELWQDPTSGADTRLVANLPSANVVGVDSDQWGAAQTPPTLTSGISEIFFFI